MKPKLKAIQERNALEQFLFKNVEHVCSIESFCLSDLASTLGLSVVTLRTLARQSRYTSYIRGSTNTPAVVLVDAGAVQQTHRLLMQEATSIATPSHEMPKPLPRISSRALSAKRKLIRDDLAAARALLWNTVPLAKMLEDKDLLLNYPIFEAVIAIDKAIKMLEEVQ